MSKMKAVVTEGNGGFEKLVYKEVPVPSCGEEETLVRVLAAGVNNTEINTRLGWYSSSFRKGTNTTSTTQSQEQKHKEDGGWNKKTPFPLIQGTDCCGIVEKSNRKELIGKRVLIRSCMRAKGFSSMDNVWMASDFDGAFAEYVVVPSTEVFPVDSEWSDVELASIPCAYGSAENMLHRTNVTNKDIVLVTGASGGIGTATIQLAKRRGAKIIAICGEKKISKLKELINPDKIISRDSDYLKEIGKEEVSVVVDNVGGENFPTMLELLKRGGRYVTSGAIAGPITELDLRTLYLKDLTLFGSTAWDEPIFPNLIRYIEKGEIKPVIYEVMTLKDIASAQELFLKKEHIGKIVLKVIDE